MKTKNTKSEFSPEEEAIIQREVENAYLERRAIQLRMEIDKRVQNKIAESRR